MCSFFAVGNINIDKVLEDNLEHLSDLEIYKLVDPEIPLLDSTPHNYAKEIEENCL